MEVKIIRRDFSNEKIVGKLFIIDGHLISFDCYTIELQLNFIPTGEYWMERKFSEEYKQHWQINVPNREIVIIHGNNTIKNHILTSKDAFGNNSNETLEELNKELKENSYKLIIK